MKNKNAKTGRALVMGSWTGDLQQRIRQRAYELWEAGGYQPGCEMEHWLQAERELIALSGEQPGGQ